MEPVIARELRKLPRSEKVELILSLLLVWALVIGTCLNLSLYRHVLKTNEEYAKALEILRQGVNASPVPKLSEVCPAWFYNTNLKVAKAEICKDYRK